MNPRWTAATILALASAGAGLGFRAVFASGPLLVAVVLLAAAGSLFVVLVTDKRGWSFPVSLATSMTSYVVIGWLIVGQRVTPAGFVEFLGSTISGWNQLLTTATPIGGGGPLLVVPFTATWVGVFVGSEIVIRTDRLATPLIGPLLTLSAAVLFGVEDKRLIAWVTALFFGLCLLYLALHSGRSWIADLAKHQGGQTRRAATASAILIAAAVIATQIGPALPFADAHDRFTLRDDIEPDFDVRDLASPLAELKGSLVEGAEDSVMFTIVGPRIQRVRIATLDSFEGTVWSIAADTSFRRVTETFPDIDSQPTGELLTHGITIDNLEGFWLPVGGSPKAARFDDGAKSLLGQDPRTVLRLDEISGSVLSARELQPGLTYTVQSIELTRPPDSRMARLGVEDDSGHMTSVPSELVGFQTFATERSGGAVGAFAKAAALESFFAEQFYTTDVDPGHSIFHINQFLSTPRDNSGEQAWAGYDEQFASSFAVLARLLGLPTRVVVGYEIPSGLAPDNPVAVRAGDIRAWAEVRFEEVGWVPFDVVPDESRAPDELGGAQTGQTDSAAPPPPPPRRENEPLPTIPPEPDDSDEEDDQQGDEENASERIPAGVKIGGAIVGAPLLLTGLIIGSIVLVKTRRRRKRRNSASTGARVQGAWLEIVDTATDSGLGIPNGLTTTEVANLIGETDELILDVTELSLMANRAGFHRDPPTSEEADMAWVIADTEMRADRDELSAKGRIRRAASVKSLVRT